MLFILVKDVLNLLRNRADTAGILPVLSAQGLKHWSQFMDDMVLFLCPLATDLVTTEELLHLIGIASIVKTNFL
jgi:hypothetical protein